MDSINKINAIIATGLSRTGRDISVEDFKYSFTPTRDNLLILWEGVTRHAFEEARGIFDCNITFTLDCHENKGLAGKQYYVYKYNAKSEQTTFSTDVHPILFSKSVRGVLIQQSLAYFDVLSRSYYQDALKSLNVDAFLDDLDLPYTSTKSYRGFRKGLSQSFEGSQASRSTWEHIKTFDKELISLSLKSRIFPMLATYQWMVANKDRVRNVVDKYGDHGIILLFEDIKFHLHGANPNQNTIDFYQRILDSSAFTKLKEISISRLTSMFDSIRHLFDPSTGTRIHNLSRFLDYVSEHGLPNVEDMGRYRDLGDDLYFESNEKRRLLGAISRYKSVKNHLYDIAPFIDAPDVSLIEYSKYVRINELAKRYLNVGMFKVKKDGVYKSKLTSWINHFTVDINVMHDLSGVHFDIKPVIRQAKARLRTNEDQSLKTYVYHAETQAKINPVVALWKSGQLELGELDSRQVAFKDILSRHLKKAQAMLIFRSLIRARDVDFEHMAPNVAVDNIFNHLGSLKTNPLTENMVLLHFVKKFTLGVSSPFKDADPEVINIFVERFLSRPSVFHDTINVAGQNISPFSVFLRIIEELYLKTQHDKQRLIETVIQKTKELRPERMNELVYVLFLHESYKSLDKKFYVDACFEEYSQFGESIAPVLLAHALKKRQSADGGFTEIYSFDHLQAFMKKNNAFKNAELINDVLSRPEAGDVVTSTKPKRLKI